MINKMTSGLHSALHNIINEIKVAKIINELHCIDKGGDVYGIMSP